MYFLYFELACFLISLVSIKKLSGVYFYFIPFLALTNLQEWGSYGGWIPLIHNSNAWSLNLFNNIEFVFYAWFFSTQTIPGRRKKIIYLTAIYLVCAMVNIIFIQGIFHFHSYSYLLGSLFMIYLVIDYFYHLLHDQTVYIHLISYPPFWIGIGILFFYVGMFSFYIYFEFIIQHLSTNYTHLFSNLMNVFNLILYGSFSIAFLCPKPPQTIR
ncbi:MAG: hypothetical protein JSS93_06665 [Bacteroidetes bacterium]|nr:hypothetical protein [Bacteroidota bacterium]